MKCICMAISICDKDNFKSKLIPHFIDGHSDQLVPCFASFKRISSLHAQNYNSDNLIANLKLIDKASIRIDSLTISFNTLCKMKEFYKNKEINFMLDSLTIHSFNKNNMSDEDIKFLNKISPKILRIHQIKWTVENIKALALLNWADIGSVFERKKNIEFSFKNTPIKLFDFQSDQMLTFEWESIKFFIQKSNIAKIKLFNKRNSNLLFIPLKLIDSIFYSGFTEILSTTDIKEKSADLGFKHHVNIDGFVVPMGYSNRISVELSDSELDFLNQIKHILNIEFSIIS